MMKPVLLFVISLLSTIKDSNSFTTNDPRFDINVGVNNKFFRNKPTTTDIRRGSAVMTPLNVVAMPLAMPSAKTVIASTFLPTCLGYWKYEYGVSYAYGTATALTSFFVLKALLDVAVDTVFAKFALLHTAAIVFYGIRLNTFLLYRELFIERFRKMRERIEEREVSKQRTSTGDYSLLSKVKARTPFITSCSLLYAGLVAPCLIVGSMVEMDLAPVSDVTLFYKLLVGITWAGFVLAALGDYTKSYSKAKNGEDHLVTGGVFSLFRHPNYTGETFGWTASFLASAVAMTSTNKNVPLKLVLLSLLATIGTIGINFVLCAATAGLEKRQKEKYGQNEKYKNWVKSSFAGFKIPQKNQ